MRVFLCVPFAVLCSLCVAFKNQGTHAETLVLYGFAMSCVPLCTYILYICNYNNTYIGHNG